MKHARQVQELTDREATRKRYPIWFGSTRPKTISAKEIIDNGLDQIADGKATQCKIAVTENSIMVWDNGVGIDTSIADDGESFMYKAVAKLFTSTNYSENDSETSTENTTGTNGVGATATNHLSTTFQVANLNTGLGYMFHTGLQVVNGETKEDFADFGPQDMNTLPILSEIGTTKGFVVSAEYDTSILKDDIQIDWIKEYVECRVGELGPSARIEFKTPSETITFVKKKPEAGADLPEGEIYAKSWIERVQDIPFTEIRSLPRLGITYAFIDVSEADNKDIQQFRTILPMVANAPVRNSTYFNGSFTIGNDRVSIQIPYSFFVKNKKTPRYTDQTKTSVEVRGTITDPLKSMSSGMYQVFYHVAENSLLKKMMKSGDNRDSYWPPMASRRKSANDIGKELFITEGYSAASGVKAMRDVNSQGVLALRGKIMNCRGKSASAAMRSDVVKKLIGILNDGGYDRMVIVTDPDFDGRQITGLILTIIDEYFPEMIDDGRIFMANVPPFVFNKGKSFIPGDRREDCPKGYECNPKKGLGSYTQAEVKAFITDPETRKLWQIDRGNKSEARRALDLAFVSCGKEWVIDKPDHMSSDPDLQFDAMVRGEEI